MLKLHAISLFILFYSCGLSQSLKPVLFVDIPGLPLLAWRYLDNNTAASSFGVPTFNVCIEPAFKNEKTLRPKVFSASPERTFDHPNNFPSQLIYNETAEGVTALNLFPNDSVEAWKRVQNKISKQGIYDPADPDLAQLMENMRTLPIVDGYEVESAGTWFKCVMVLSDGTEVLFKPQRFQRNESRQNPDTFYFSDFERHHAEIAAFHVSRVLGMYWVPPTVGRVINITHDIERHAADQLKETIYSSPVGNKCVLGNCDECVHDYNAFCGNPDTVEGSLMFVVPLIEQSDETAIQAPYKRSYKRFQYPEWFEDNYYCDEIEEEFNRTRLLLDIVDIAIFDFIIGNQDRHHLQFYPQLQPDSFPLLIDNGRGFGRSDFDDELILTPVPECCWIRYSTFKRLTSLRHGKLSKLFLESSKDDVSHPVLPDDFLPALDRRLERVIQAIKKCVSLERFGQVFKDDNF